jgi:uncharacterized SAM-binding protein YcdF (DUF218 family)
MIDFIKESIQLINFFLLLFFLLVIGTYYFTFKKTRWFWYFTILIFLAASTNLIPSQLVINYEAKTSICNPYTLNKNETYYLHVLGAGYSLDPRLPATSQLSATTLTRLVEGIRIARNLKKYTIVTSAYSKFGLEPQASVAKRAAIVLGIPAENIKMLTTPSNTAEEVEAFVAKFGIHKKVIVVSDAMHLPRAIMLYKKAGINAVGAPTNFQVKKGLNDFNGISFPSLSSLNLMNAYCRERLKYYKDLW